ncbi:unnamed protein product [Polarella glacialis]|uniref:5'-nucleotidase n=1 Tax=Polarella glacialis TaxID=89957 RepID=A0A813EQY3_POLGL|nr:unnamed protein product [Polarella glacialis]
MKDALPFLNWAVGEGYLLSVTTNTPCRTMDSVLPFMGLHQYFRCFTCSQDVGAEKPDLEIFQHSLEEMRKNSKHILEGSVQSDEIREFDPETFNHAEIKFVNRYQKLLRSPNEDLQPDQILHIGDSFAADLCGPKAAGWQGIHLDRSGDPNVRIYQDWLEGPAYAGKTEEDIRVNTVFSLDEVRSKLEAAAGSG